MILNFKSTILRIIFIYSFFLFVTNVYAQLPTQQFHESFTIAFSNYNNYYFTNVPNDLEPCKGEIYRPNNLQYYQTDPVGQEWVFKFYKLMTEAYYNAELYDLGDQSVEDLTNYFYNIIPYETVLNILENTQL